MMERDDLMAMVSETLGEAIQRNDTRIIMLMQAFGERLLAEVRGDNVREAMTAIAEDNGAPPPPPCPACEERRKAKLEAQHRYRAKRRAEKKNES